jgi:HK97 family phage major capsid protein
VIAESTHHSVSERSTIALTNTTGSALLRPEQVFDLLIEPTMAASVAAQICNTVNTDAGSFRIPFVAADPSAQWVDEGDEITPSDMTLSELNVVLSRQAAGLARHTLVT